MGYRPKIADSPSVSVLDIRTKPYFVVASVEVGNTTTKCILMATNLEDGKTRHITKNVRMTRDVRKPKPGETAFGKTLSGVEFTRESVAELVRDTLLDAVKKAKLDVKTDLNFVVRSTGVVAGFDVPDDVGEFIKAMADGCLMADVPPNKMTPPMSLDNISKEYRKYSKLNQVIFDGAVASVNPPTGATGVEVVANEMEGELVTAGIKEGAKWADIDYRNPCISIDFGTTLAGRIISPDEPYANTIGNLCGYAGAIPDAIIRGTGKVDENLGTALEIFDQKVMNFIKMKMKDKTIQNFAEKIHEHINIEKVPVDRNKYGSVPVNPSAAKDSGVILIGCDVGENGSDLDKLMELGAEIYKKEGLQVVYAVLDEVMAKVVYRLIKVANEEGLVFDDTAIGLSGRAALTGNKPKLILEYLDELQIHDKIDENVVFVDDGLARGAAVMARCMNSLGTPSNPLGGHRGGKCILGERIKLQNK
ncbi:methanogenesis marker 14 protein [Methanohalobium sp.]|uniref:methanogenesis marker 14 protein n=1 Tax=Methanohalobium sp. TaxID=2837493 RepID=UPI0025F43852|nr:methanogenesis marker 14 protein [Methanohalobium sp.]